MASFAQGQPFSSGSVWDQMRFGTDQGAAMPIAGSYMDQVRSIMTSIPSDISKDDRTLYGLIGVQHLGAVEAAKQNKEMMQYFLTHQERASEKANEMGLRNVVIGSVVDAIKGLPNAAQGQRYTPEQIAIAARAMEIQPRGGTRPNYYGFVR